jgi:short-subunit dehydrogenase
LEQLEEMRKQLPGTSCARRMDITAFNESVNVLGDMIGELGGLDLIILCAGVDCNMPHLELDKLRLSVDTNVTGFSALANAAYNYFEKQGQGHICGISSVAALRGIGMYPEYSATKAFVSNYMEGLLIRAKTSGLRIRVTDIRPGFVDTPMTKGQPGMFWLAAPDKVASQILSAIRRGKRIAYVPPRWDILARLIRIMPFSAAVAINKNASKEPWVKEPPENE